MIDVKEGKKDETKSDDMLKIQTIIGLSKGNCATMTTCMNSIFGYEGCYEDWIAKVVDIMVNNPMEFNYKIAKAVDFYTTMRMDKDTFDIVSQIDNDTNISYRSFEPFMVEMAMRNFIYGEAIKLKSQKNTADNIFGKKFTEPEIKREKKGKVDDKDIEMFSEKIDKDHSYIADLFAIGFIELLNDIIK